MHGQDGEKLIDPVGAGMAAADRSQSVLQERAAQIRIVTDGVEMALHAAFILGHQIIDAGLRRSLAEHGLATIRARHSCAHRAEELLTIAAQLDVSAKEPA